jgi:hypothetical protein
MNPAGSGLFAGCAATRPISDVALGAGGAYLGHELSNGDPLATAAGAAGGVIVSETLHYAARKQAEKAYATQANCPRLARSQHVGAHFCRQVRQTTLQTWFVGPIDRRPSGLVAQLSLTRSPTSCRLAPDFALFPSAIGFDRRLTVRCSPKTAKSAASSIALADNSWGDCLNEFTPVTTDSRGRRARPVHHDGFEGKSACGLHPAATLTPEA